jgi:hypothetical protein
VIHPLSITAAKVAFSSIPKTGSDTNSIGQSPTRP